MAPAACSGWNRWWKWRLHAGRVSLWSGRAGGRARPVDAGLLEGAQDHALAQGDIEDASLPEAPAAADVLPYRPHRPAVHRRLPGPSGFSPAWRRRCSCLPRPSLMRSRPRACAAVAAPRSLPASSGRPCTMSRRRSEVHRLQCRRRRLRHLRRPAGDGVRPLHADRRHDHCRPRRGCHPGLHLSALGIPGGPSHPRRRPWTAPMPAGYLGDDILGSRQAVRSGSPPGRGRLHLRRGNLAAGQSGRASGAWCAPSRRCRRSRACSASPPWSTTCCPWRLCRLFWTGARQAYADYGMGRSRGTLPSSWRVTSSAAVWLSWPLASPCGS